MVGVVWSGLALGVLWSYHNLSTQFALVQIVVVGRKWSKVLVFLKITLLFSYKKFYSSTTRSGTLCSCFFASPSRNEHLEPSHWREAKKSNREEKYKILSSSSEIRNCTVAWQGAGHFVPLLCLPIAPPDVLHLASLRLYAIATNRLSFEHLSYRKFKFRFKFLKSPQQRMTTTY